MKKVLLIGPVFNQSGYGEHARNVMRALRKNSNIDLYLLATAWAKTSIVSEDTEEHSFFKYCLQKHQLALENGNAAYDVTIQVSVPNEYQKLAPVNIGVTAGVESDKISMEFIEGCNKMNKIITTSSFSKEILESTSYVVDGKKVKIEVPVEYIGYPVKVFGTSSESKLKFDTKFNFLTVGQICPRRNMESCVRWFVEQFHDNKDVGLVVKTSYANNCTQDRFFTEKRLKELVSNYKNKKCSVYLLHGPMTDQEMDDLYKHPDINCLITTTHGEGYGLPLFEAAYNGLPIIAPDYSGYKDFLYHQIGDSKKPKALFATVDYLIKPVQQEALMPKIIIEGSNWAYAKENSFKNRLSEVYKDHGRFKKQANELKNIIREKYTAKKIADEFNNSFSEFFGTTSFASFFDVSEIE
jgi:glycosyltransferase involved in cell wall biosynthesis